MSPERESRPGGNRTATVSTATKTPDSVRAFDVRTRAVRGWNGGEPVRTVKVECPLCGQVHGHGWPINDPKIGFRVADCGLGSYYVEVPAA